MSDRVSAEAPAQTRADAATQAPDGAVVLSGVAALRRALAGHASAFADWRREPMTRVVLRALQGFLLHPPAGVQPADALVQYGVSQGLLLALQLMVDPSLIWPGVFGEGATQEAGLPEMDFETSLDEVLGK